VTAVPALERRRPAVSGSTITAVLVVVAVLAGAGATWTVVEVGHSGAKATWSDVEAGEGD
jgi:hypothetical protein